jgi:outer membrane protein assembly factor BamD
VKATIAALAIIASCLLAGCAAKSPRVRLDAEDQYGIAKSEFDREKYSKAAEGFRRLLFEHPGSAKVDEAQYLLAMCFYLDKDYLQAEAEFKHFILNYPDSPYADNASYYVGMTHYKQMPSYYHDQTETMNAVDLFSRFLVKFPDSRLVPQAEARIAECRDRLARKDLENGLLYLKLKRYGPARLYLEYVATEYSETRWAEEAARLLDRHHQELGGVESEKSQADK